MRHIDAFCHFFPAGIFKLMSGTAGGTTDVGKRMQGVRTIFDLDARFRMMDEFKDYTQILSAQLIAENGDKKFLPGGRAKGAVFRLGMPKASRPVLCEGFATGLSIDAALKRLPGEHAVIVCFSAKNLELVAQDYRNAVVAGDNDMSATGEETAKRTGLKWTMPYEIGADWNDLHRNIGLHAVVERMRELLAIE